MSLREIEDELDRLKPEELRQLALKSWSAFVARDNPSRPGRQCNEDDPELLAALDESIRQADANPRRGLTGNELRSRLSEWISR
jgi:hypothetical protein